MKFFYCVRAATKESQQLPIGDMITSTAVDIVNTNKDYLSTDSTTDPDQSSDADSEFRSDIGESTTVINGSNRRSTIQTTQQDEPVNSTSTESSQTVNATTTTNASTGTKMSSVSTTSSAASTTDTVALSAVATTKPITSTNGSENQKKESKLIASDAIKVEVNTSPTTSNRTEHVSNAASDKSQSDRKSNGTSPKPNTSKRRSSNGMKFF